MVGMVKFKAHACAGQSISNEAQEKVHLKSSKKTSQKIPIFRDFFSKII